MGCWRGLGCSGQRGVLIFSGLLPGLGDRAAGRDTGNSVNQQLIPGPSFG